MEEALLIVDSSLSSTDELARMQLNHFSEHVQRLFHPCLTSKIPVESRGVTRIGTSVTRWCQIEKTRFSFVLRSTVDAEYCTITYRMMAVNAQQQVDIWRAQSFQCSPRVLVECIEVTNVYGGSREEDTLQGRWGMNQSTFKVFFFCD